MARPDADERYGYWKEAHLQADARRLWQLAGFHVTDLSVRRSGPGRGGMTVEPGVPDAYLQHPALGLRTWVEYKLPGGTPRAEQRAWHQHERAAGGDVWLVRTLRDVADWCQVAGVPLELEEVD